MFPKTRSVGHTRILVLRGDCLQLLLLLWHRASDQPRNILLFHFLIIKINWITKNEKTCSVLAQGRDKGSAVVMIWSVKASTQKRGSFFHTRQDLLYIQCTQKTVTLRNKIFLSSKLLWDSKWTLPIILLNTLDTISHAAWHMLSYSAHPAPHNIVNDSVQNVHA